MQFLSDRWWSIVIASQWHGGNSSFPIVLPVHLTRSAPRKISGGHIFGVCRFWIIRFSSSRISFERWGNHPPDLRDGRIVSPYQGWVWAGCWPRAALRGLRRFAVPWADLLHPFGAIKGRMETCSVGVWLSGSTRHIPHLQQKTV